MKYKMIHYMCDYDCDDDGIRLRDGEEKEICIRSFVCVSRVEESRFCAGHITVIWLYDTNP